ncbi:MAG TPA: hypothetical protein VHM67_02190 [Gemmatimonadaceae bacterium]|nr:hypothetical protein [Gemmatimonadaceae bacterium]
MESGGGVGTWIAYGLIVLFVVLVVFIVAATALRMSLMFVEPARELWQRLVGRDGGGER